MGIICKWIVLNNKEIDISLNLYSRYTLYSQNDNHAQCQRDWVGPDKSED